MSKPRLEGGLKYLVVPGWIGEHYVTGVELIRLYNVDPAQCRILNGPGDFKGYGAKELQRLTILFPRHSGDYTINKTAADSPSDIAKIYDELRKRKEGR